jgi:hypothetical protein
LNDLPDAPDNLTLFSTTNVATYGLLLPWLKPNGYLSSLHDNTIIASYALMDKDWQQYKLDGDGMSTGTYYNRAGRIK